MQRLLKSQNNGALYNWTSELAKQPFMVEVFEPEPANAPETTVAPAEVVAEQSAERKEAEAAFLAKLEAMTKAELDEYGMEEFGLKLDRRKSEKVLIDAITSAARESGVI